MTPSVEYALIPLSQGQFAKVSPHRYEHLMQWKWFAAKRSKNGEFYAGRQQRGPEGQRMISLHRYILDLPQGDPRVGDHRNGDTLDNTDENLRVATAKQNGYNKRRYRTNTTGYKGVVWHPERWSAAISVNGRTKNLGFHKTPELAHEAYCRAARLYHGDFARLN